MSNKYTTEQKKFILELYNRIIHDKKLTLVNDFIRLFNQRYPNINVSLKGLRHIVDEMKVTHCFFAYIELYANFN